MEVGDGLGSVRAVVDDQAKAAIEVQLLGHHARGQQQVSEGGLIPERGFADARYNFFGYDQQVNGGLWLDVVEDDAVFVLMLDARRDLAVGDLLEKGFHGSSE